MNMRVLFLCFLALATFTTSPVAADQGQAAKVIFVLDASGSMWGQIQGKAKITIAKEVMNQLVDQLPKGMNVGLIAYGHRRKGDCQDIETILPVGPLNKAAFKGAIKKLNAKGKTPLSAAVTKAAKELRYTEDRAMVVLVSDGLETCAAAPCTLAAELARSGVDFTVHVVGFAVSKEEQERLRCMADRTGGMFLSADNAVELKNALLKTVARMKKPPAPVVKDPGKAKLTGPASVKVGSVFMVKWQGPNSRGDYVEIGPKDPKRKGAKDYAYVKSGNPVRLTVPGKPGAYELRYIHAASRKIIGRTDIKATPVKAAVQAPDQVDAAQKFEVKWDGPGYTGDFISIAKADQKPSAYKTYQYTGTNPVKLTAPSDPGTYEVRYILSRGNQLLAQKAITVKAVGASIKAPDQVDAAAKFEVSWTGPGTEDDYISIAKPDQKPSSYLTYQYARKNPVTLQAPSDPGTYQVRYVLGQGNKLLAKTAITVKAVSASIKAPQEAAMGAMFEVSWTGPGTDDDYISIAKPGQKPHKYLTYQYTSKNPVKLRAPANPGTYQVRYILGQGHKLLAKAAITITPVNATIEAPATAKAGQPIPVKWTGPGYEDDYISIAKPDHRPSKYLTYQYARQNPIKLEAPKKPGTYEVRYIMGLDNKLLHKKKIEVQ